jgi:hypothetical protein
MSVSRTRSRLANEVKRAKRTGQPVESFPAVQAARGELAEAKIAAYITAVVSAAPPLSAQQRDRLATLLKTGRAAS